MPSIKFKNFNDAFFLAAIRPQLKEVFCFIVEECGKNDIDLEITSVFRPVGGVHSLYRAVDLVPVDRDIEKMEWIRKLANDNFDYGKEGYEVCPAVRHGTAPHNHLQTRLETQRRENAHT